MKVAWTDQAYERLAEIHDFIARDSEEAADRLVDKVIQRGDRLADFPQKGRVVPELPGLGLRELIEGNYRIVYRLVKSKVEILTVFEGHLLFPIEDIQSGDELGSV